MTDDICAVVITAPDAAWLADFVRSLVDDRLCAAGHNISDIRSIYSWKNVTEDRHEAHATLHTRADLVPSIIDRTNSQHPYEVPCVVAIPITTANPSYKQWVLDETREP
jgi:periplasmic divalent cation tolerance protein